MPADVRDVLYSVINEIGREKIRMDVAANVDVSEKYCGEILGRCKNMLGPEVDDVTLATLCEALLHFMLTASILSSERKVSLLGSDLDVVIPSIRMLVKNPDKALVIQVVRDDLAARVAQARSVQSRHENIWLVSARPLQTDHRNYHVGPGNFPYTRIISDISAFLAEKGDRGLKLLHDQ
ncbi:MAG TPA: hypothetical protein VD736_03105 [Nitrososphaera sp.]|nr:hypothetical protein [Nitrososphaera sp.]